MNEDRLTRLADLLERDANNPTGVMFDLGCWAASTNYEDAFWKPEVSCGTTACAWGLAAISGIFKDEGVSLHVYHKSILEVRFDGQHGFAAAARFFEIPMEDAEYLFSEVQYDGAPRIGRDGELFVATRIRNYIKKRNVGMTMKRADDGQMYFGTLEKQS